MFDSIEKKLLNANLDAVNLIIFLLGIIVLLIGIFINPQAALSNDIKVILISVGSSLIASSIMAYLSARYLVRRNKIKDIVENWGLEGIYNTRSEMNQSSNKVMENMSEMDIIGLGLKSLIDAKGEVIADRVKKGLKMRILASHPDNEFLRQREKDEQVNEGYIRHTIISLEKWVDELKKISPNPNNIKLKFYTTLPIDSYLREDDHIYIGPFIYGKTSQQTISYEFKKDGRGYNYYYTYFERLWNDENFAKEK